MHSLTTDQTEMLCLLVDEAPHVLEGRTYVQKLMFLFQREADENWFTFEPYDYGPFSRKLYKTLDVCIDREYVTERTEEDEDGCIRYHYEPGPAIDDVLDQGGNEGLRDVLAGVFDEYPTTDLHELVKNVYSDYPAMARNSV